MDLERLLGELQRAVTTTVSERGLVGLAQKLQVSGVPAKDLQNTVKILWEVASVPLSERKQGGSEELRCAFCHRRQSDVWELVATPSVAICDRCIQIARGSLKRQPSSIQEGHEERTGRLFSRGVMWLEEATRFGSVSRVLLFVLAVLIGWVSLLSAQSDELLIAFAAMAAALILVHAGSSGALGARKSSRFESDSVDYEGR